MSTEAKAAIARAHGCDEIILYSHEDVAKRVRELTDGVGVSVVFDSVGKDTFMASLDSLKRRGLMVYVGAASGTVPPFDLQQLAVQGVTLSDPPGFGRLYCRPGRKGGTGGRSIRACRRRSHQNRN